MIQYDWGGAECSANEYRDWLRAHPRKGQLRSFAHPETHAVYIYDIEAFERDKHHGKSPTSHKVAYRTQDRNDGRWRFIVLP